MLTRGSWAGFCRLASARPGMANNNSSTPARRSAARESGLTREIANGSSMIERGPSRVADSDRKSTRLNSSHTVISYAVFCLQKKDAIDQGRLALGHVEDRVQRRLD